MKYRNDQTGLTYETGRIARGDDMYAYHADTEDESSESSWADFYADQESEVECSMCNDEGEREVPGVLGCETVFCLCTYGCELNALHGASVAAELDSRVR